MVKVVRRLIDVTGMTDIVHHRIPVLTLDSQRDGPSVWVCGCIHGDEPGGAAIIHDVVKAVRQTGLAAGTLHALPMINPMGFENISRFINSDREDLNRCFPGDPKGTTGERIAHRLFELISKTEPELVIDLHNDWIQSVPYALVEARAFFAASGKRTRTIELAAATGLLLVQEREVSELLSRTLTGALVAHGVPAFTIEAGGACGVVEAGVEAGKNAVLGVLQRLDMLSTKNDAVAPPRPRVLDYTSQPRCSSSGIVRFEVAPGDAVAANQPIARIYSAFGSVEETLKANRPGYVLGVADHARAIPGMEVIAIAEDRHESQRSARTTRSDRPARIH